MSLLPASQSTRSCRHFMFKFWLRLYPHLYVFLGCLYYDMKKALAKSKSRRKKVSFRKNVMRRYPPKDATKVQKLQFYWNKISMLLKGEHETWYTLEVPTRKIFWVVPETVLRAGQHPRLAYIQNGIEHRTYTEDTSTNWRRTFDYKRGKPLYG